MTKVMNKRQKLKRSKPENDKTWREKLENKAKTNVGRFKLLLKDENKRRKMGVAAFFLVLLTIAIVGSSVSLLNCDAGFRSVCNYLSLKCRIIGISLSV